LRISCVWSRQTFDLSSSTATPRSLHSQDFATPSSLQNFPHTHHSHIDITTHSNSSRIQSLVGTSEISPRVIPVRFVPYADTLDAAGGEGGGREGSKLPISGRFICILMWLYMCKHTQAHAHFTCIVYLYIMCVCLCVCVYTYIHTQTHIHTYIDTDVYKHTQTMIYTGRFHS
jgi:hypothetical protein